MIYHMHVQLVSNVCVLLGERVHYEMVDKHSQHVF